MAKGSPRRKRVTPGRKKLQVKSGKAKKKGIRPGRIGTTAPRPMEHESEEQQSVLKNPTPAPPEPSDPHSSSSQTESAALSSLPSTLPPPLPPPPLADASNAVDANLQDFLENLSEFDFSLTSLVDFGLPRSDLPDCFTVQETDNDSLYLSPYSVASSRTESTDYGIYARRMALSQPGSNDPSPFFEPLETFGSFSPFTQSPECFSVSPFTHSPENFSLSSFSHSPLAQLSPVLNTLGDYSATGDAENHRLTH